MTNRHESSPAEVEELPVSDAARHLLELIYDAPYNSTLRDVRDAARTAVARGAISASDFEVVISEKDAKQKSLTTTPSVEVYSGPPTDDARKGWSPTAVLDRMPQEREFDWAERAAGEHLDRD